VKVVINKCFGGFGLSNEAYEWLISKGVPVYDYVQYQERNGRFVYKSDKDFKLFANYWDNYFAYNRADPLLVEVVQTLKKAASSSCAELVIIEVPNDVDWEIAEYDGMEHIAEKHRTWG